ncbi:hypothetical protein BJ508DRAFT_326420 [Ascobolus immersus RN42]|uniref:Uncharacterized protein n=1 Tax=Ascobolus immersus RN42 TaxID=1160509 RepID=A0A3N4I611_ASCIM|nr:hypothetical protein BJ508DRAFT_326420 [Ascobolus immersus RN42]
MDENTSASGHGKAAKTNSDSEPPQSMTELRIGPLQESPNSSDQLSSQSDTQEVDPLIPSIPATPSECIEFFEGLAKERHRSSYSAKELEALEREFENPEIIEARYHKPLRQILHTPPPWSGAPVQLNLRLQQALYEHMETRPPLMQYYQFLIPPAYKDPVQLFDVLRLFCAKCYPPALQCVAEQLLCFYLEEVCPYLVTLEPEIAALPLSSSSFLSPKQEDRCAIEIKCLRPTQHIKQECLAAVLTFTAHAEDGRVSPSERYYRGLLTPDQTRILAVIARAMLSGMRSKIRTRAGAETFEMEARRWLSFLVMFANRVRSERILRLVLVYFDEPGHNRFVAEEVEVKTVAWERERDRLRNSPDPETGEWPEPGENINEFHPLGRRSGRSHWHSLNLLAEQARLSI